MEAIECKSIKENLSAYIDNLLDAEQSNIVKEHLQNCEECKQEFDTLSEIVSLLSEMESVTVPASFDARLKKALQIEKNKSSWNFKRKIAMISSVAAVFVIGIFSITMYNYMSDANNDANEYIGIAALEVAPSGIAPLRMYDTAGGNGAIADVDVMSEVVDPFIWGFSTSPGDTPPIGELEMPYLSFRHSRENSDVYALQLASLFLYEQYNAGNSAVNIPLPLADDVDIIIFHWFNEIDNTHVFKIELAKGSLRETHVLGVKDGIVSFKAPEVFEANESSFNQMILCRCPYEVLCREQLQIIEDIRGRGVLDIINNYPD